jgi:hypothetical protein
MNRMIDFLTSEDFHQWCAEHQDDGFFAGYALGYPPAIARAKEEIPRLHRARCRTVPMNRVGPYGKCGSTKLSELVDRFAPAGLMPCGHCHPLERDA